MQDYLKELFSKKNIINILILAILILAIPLSVNLARKQQILFSRAATDSVQLVDNTCTIVREGKKVLTCPTVTLNFVSPAETDVHLVHNLVKTAYAASCSDNPPDAPVPNSNYIWKADCNASQCSGNDSCPKNTSDPNNVNPDTSAWCYGFDDGANPRCMQLQYTGSHSAPADDCKDNPVAPPSGYLWKADCTHFCKANSDCPQNTSDPNVSADTSAWCYGFNAAPRCMQLQHIAVAPPATPVAESPGGNTGGNNIACTIGKVCGTACGSGGVGVCDECNKGWCRGGSCATCSAGGSATSPATPTPAPAPAAGAPVVPAAVATLVVAPNPAVKTNNQWPNLTLTVTADSGVSWNVFYYNLGTCTPTSCGLAEGWTAIGNGSGNAAINWSSAQSANVPAGLHTFAVFDRNNTRILSTYDVNFTPGGAAATPTPSPSSQNIVKVWYSENASDLTNPNARHEIAYKKGGVKQDITFASETVGAKFIYAQFVDDKGQTINGNPYPFQIDLIGPTPAVTGFACEVDIANSSDLLFKFTGNNFGATQGTGTVTLKDGGSLVSPADLWTNTAVTMRLKSPPVSATTLGTRYFATLTNSSGQKSPEQQCLVGITQLSLGAKLFCRAQRNFDQDNVDLTLVSAKDHTQKSREKTTIDKDGNIVDIKTKLKSGENYIACIKAPLSLRKCSAPFTASSGTNNLSINLPIGDYNGDGTINSADSSLLRSQWGPMNSSKNCDVNRDGICNSFEWSCMLPEFNSSNQPEP